MNIINGLCLLGIIILLISFFSKFGNFLDVRSIVKQHLEIFKGNYLQMISIFIVPIFFAIRIVLTKTVDEGILNNLNIVLTILITMLFSTLSILCSLRVPNDNERYHTLLEETFVSTVFEALLCLLLMIISFIILFLDNFNNTIWMKVLSVLVYYLVMLVFMNILVIIKRINVLFENRPIKD